MNNFSLKSLPKLAIIAATTVFFSCNLNTSPDDFFGKAVLNTNTISDFGTDRLARHIQQATLEFADIPSSKKKGDEAQIFINNKVLYMEKVLKDVNELPENDDTKEIKALSLSTFEYVLPVYKNEYTAYAKLCDAKGPEDQKQTIIQNIEQKYVPKFEEKFALLLEKGKAYAQKHDLNVKWD
ncbi:hypothetical protein OQX61_21355 [Pedobacter sp. PLR]|uniref:hypothetical protein n=1 Tax=Pedobacter sp. PLR TaxID=2994465 RepID=UPI00224782BB|nr:hypothetical protein [Pedobacter sp. PLR]MCX2453830.1 hypothetical protein [Pedobacter sp. PLR]